MGRLRGADGRYYSSDGERKDAEAVVAEGDPAPATVGKRRRRSAQQQIAEALPEIAEMFVKEAKQGSIPHAKALAALSSMNVWTASDDLRRERSSQRREQSLTEQLMQELRRGREDEDEAS